MPRKKVSRIKYLVLSIFILVLSLFTYHFSLITAQTQSALEKAQNDYNFQFTKYRDAQDEYTTAKAAYSTFKTAVSKNNAYTKTRDYLIAVDNLYISYIRLVKEHGNKFTWGQLSFQKEQIAKLLDDEINYFSQHQTKTRATNTLEDLPEQATQLKTHLVEELDKKIYKTLATYEVAEVQGAFDEFNTLSQILDRVVVFKLRAGESKSIVSNWATEIKSIKENTNSQLNKSLSALNATPQNSASSGELEIISQLASGAKEELKRSKPLFAEVVTIL